MSQAMNTAMSGINANQLHLNVVSDNIANMNTTAVKESTVTFQDVWYQTNTTGTAPQANIGGTNPYQIGVGTTVSAITKNLEPNNMNITGKTTDMALAGYGFFTVQTEEGDVLLTRDGSFDIDADGNLVTSEGHKVLGTNNSLSGKSSTIPIHIPQLIQGGAYAQPVTQFSLKSVSDLNNAQITNGDFHITTNNADGTTTTHTINVHADGDVNAMINGPNGINTQLQALGAGIECTIVDGGFEFEITDTTNINSLEFTSGESNFVQQCELSLLGTGTTYTSTTIDFRVDVSEGTDVNSALAYSSMSVGTNGVIEVRYSNGDSITVYEDPVDQTRIFKYTTAIGVEILGPDDVNVNQSVLVPENLQIQFANVQNPEGLVAQGANLYNVGPNTGDIIFSQGNANGIGSCQTGGLEASNVDLARQFQNMILAQRGVEANSRIFDTANNILGTLVYLGRG